jgi:ceramide kinase-like protein
LKGGYFLSPELKQDSPWKVMKGQFMNVSVLTIPGCCEIAPQGLSKVTHLHDGNIDLITVKTVERKEFLRFLKRHGNSKNQVRDEDL